jgi:hypothetical protein
LICRRQRSGGTDGSNPAPSSGESSANLTSSKQGAEQFQRAKLGDIVPEVIFIPFGDRGFESCFLRRRVSYEPDKRMNSPIPIMIIKLRAGTIPRFLILLFGVRRATRSRTLRASNRTPSHRWLPRADVPRDAPIHLRDRRGPPRPPRMQAAVVWYDAKNPAEPNTRRGFWWRSPICNPLSRPAHGDVPPVERQR